MQVLETVRKNEEWRNNCINLIASENVMSPLATRAYYSDFEHRYAEGKPFKRYYQGTKFIDEIESATIELAKKTFHCKQADLRPISGALANMCVFSAIIKHGDNIVVPSVPMGAHITHQKFGAAGIVGAEINFYEFDAQSLDVKMEQTVELIKTVKPRLATFGASFFLFPHPVKELAKVAHDVGAKVMYDAAHVFGLIAGGKFQQPLEEGADIMTASTHKTLPGPQGGIILGNFRETEAADSAGTWKQVEQRVFPGLVSNHHLHRLPALYVTLLETQKFGAEYADQIVKNSQALAKSLDRLGFDVLAKSRGYTQSHQVAINVSSLGGGKPCAQLLEQANIITNMNLLPNDDVKNSMNPSGIRLGTQEMTRFGMKEEQMHAIAEMIEQTLVKKTRPEKVCEQAAALRKEFSALQYCFKTEGELNDFSALG